MRKPREIYVVIISMDWQVLENNKVFEQFCSKTIENRFVQF